MKNLVEFLVYTVELGVVQLLPFCVTTMHYIFLTLLTAGLRET